MPFPGLLSASHRASPSSSSSLSLPGTGTASVSSSSLSTGRIRARPSDDSLGQPDFIHDEGQLPCRPPETPDLRELNNSLEALTAVFPDIQVEVFRELLANFDGESRLALVADALLKNGVAWVKGRWRVVDKNRGIPDAAGVPQGEEFRRPGYKKAVQALAWGEFRGLPRSTIHAVLAECNYSYLDARRTLLSISSKSWRFTLSAWIMRRKPVGTGESDNHPLVVWRSTGQGSIAPTIRATGDAELDRELFDVLIRPLHTRDKEQREERDHKLAQELNSEEADKYDATHECTCCFTDGPFEEFTHCTSDGHMVCFRCVQHTLKEALFGQGWHSSVNPETGTLRCMAVEGDECPGCIPADHIYRALMEEPKGAEILHKMDQRLAEHSILSSKLPLIRCPFCNYAEIDDIYVPSHEPPPRLRIDGLHSVLFLGLCVGVVPLFVPFVLLSALVCLIISSNRTLGSHLETEWAKALGRHRRRRRGLKFTCQNPRCARLSCLSCDKPWKDIHVCNESSLVALRTQVEQAMSLAIKRVCPRCSTSFVKNAGCNKLTCPCGYKMCYVCRADLNEEGYRHYCDHFRPQGDARPCRDCDRCNLWESEDTDRVLRAARDEAERKWKDAERRDLSGADRAFLETGVATGAPNMRVGTIFGQGRLPTTGEVFDLVVETLLV